MRSVMTHQFSQVPSADIPRSSFDRSHGYKTTFDAGWLVPFYVDEALPGDTFNMNVNVFARLATPLHPFMDNMSCDVFFFFCPLRLVWNNFQKFMGEQDNPDDPTDFLIPQIVAPAVTGFAEGTLFDYFGVPTKVPGLSLSALFSRAYNLTWNQWFRDQNMQDSVVVDKDDGPDTPGDYVLLRRGKRHDYFTSALPWPQKGPAVEVPIGATAPLTFSPAGWSGNANVSHIGTGGAAQQTVFPLTAAAQSQVIYGTGVNSFNPANPLAVQFSQFNSRVDATLATGVADLSSATATAINAIRQAFQVQKLLERDARGGTRYTEIIQAHFGVTSPDARLQRVEYLGGGTSPLNVNPIAQTSSTDGEPTPQGNLAAFGTLAMNGIGFTKSFTEHGILLGLVSVRADLNYQQGLNRMFSRLTKYDFYWPALSHIGEQAVLNKEIYAVGSANPTQDNAAFGYQERWAEMRYKPSLVTGQMRSNAATTLDTWHLSQNFTALPVLNSAFIVENPPVDRVIAVPSEPHLLFDSYMKLRCARPMPVYSVPGLIDHF